MALKLNSSLSLLPSTLSPKLSSNSSSSSSSSFLFSLTHFQSKTRIIPFLYNHCPMKSAALSTLAAKVGVREDLPFDYGDIFPKADPSERKRAGVLLHPTSFRGPHGIGDLREEAFRFIDWLHEAGCSLWQVLPLVPPGWKANEEGSTYAGQDAKCGNTLLISLDELVKNGLLTKEELPKPMLQRGLLGVKVNLKVSLKLSVLTLIYQISIFIAEQFLFQRQWQKVRKYAQMKGISIMGDMPIYVGYHTADVWANRKHFLLNRNGFPLQVSGVPPDAFSETGQLWNSPLYDWKSMEKEGFSWWICRIRRAQNICDEFRIDHFRGLAGFWAVPSEEKVATVGRWEAGPGKSFFDALNRAVGKMNIVAEDLIRRWWDVLKQEEKSNVLKYLSITEEDDIPGELTKAALSSVARTAIIPMQDILRLGNSARMNIPATRFGNWGWMIPSSTSFDSLESEASQLRDVLLMYGRL